MWRVQTTPLNVPELKDFTQTIAQEMTELVQTNEQLAQDNAELRKTSQRIRGMFACVGERAREQETLEIKMRVHNDIGKSLIALSALAQSGGGEPNEQLQTLHRAVRLFAENSLALPGTLEEVRREAAELHVTLHLDGIVPQGGEVERLISAAARECVTNCVRHANGSRVTIKITEAMGGYTVTMTNDGDAPSGPIIEGGGLSSLRRSVEETGGEMHISYAPAFALILNLTGKDSAL